MFGARDPLWAILTQGDKKNGGWDPAEFFLTGVREIESALAYVESRHPLRSRRRALDFGCGVGRLMQALAVHFDHVDGVDISPSMIAEGRRYNRFPERCRYVLNDRPDLRVFPDQSFDFIYSNITLQHMPPRYSSRYIAEFLRVLAPGGVLLFQLPGRMQGVGVRWIHRALYHLYCLLLRWFRPRQPYIAMYGMRKDKVARLIASHGGQLIEAVADRSAGPKWESYRYLVTRPTPNGNNAMTSVD